MKTTNREPSTVKGARKEMCFKEGFKKDIMFSVFTILKTQSSDCLCFNLSSETREKLESNSSTNLINKSYSDSVMTKG